MGEREEFTAEIAWQYDPFYELWSMRIAIQGAAPFEWGLSKAGLAVLHRVLHDMEQAGRQADALLREIVERSAPEDITLVWNRYISEDGRIIQPGG